MPVLFGEADFEVLCHATEDKDKVIEAVKNLIPVELHPSLQISEVKLEGHYHNPIIKINITVAGDAAVRKTVSLIFNTLQPVEKNELTENLKLYIDETGNFYLRLNKNMAYKRYTALKCETGDVIRLKVKLRKEKPLSSTEILNEYKNILTI